MQHQSAMTLLELLVALAILSIVFVTAIPGLSSLLLNVRMQNRHQRVNALSLRLPDSMRTQRASAPPCAAASMVNSAARPVNGHRAGCCLPTLMMTNRRALIRENRYCTSSRLIADLRLYANRDAFVMRPFGLRNTNGTLIWCDKRGAADARAVIVSFTGKPRSSLTTASGLPLNCPDNP